MTRKKLILIDSNALVHRAFHALPPLSSQKGELTNAVYGFTSLLLKVINELKPDYIVACFDLPKPTFRHKEFEEYKAHRKATPDDLVPQFEKVKEVLRAFEIPIFEKEGFEADDLLGTISRILKEDHENIETIIVTGDLDTLQLVDDGKTKVYTLKKGITDVVIYDEKAVNERYGLKPDQMVDFKGLKGDPSDNIPGVPGVGDKTATNLLKEYGTLENIYENVELLPKKISEKLKENKDQAFFSKKLATIKQDVPVKFNIKDAEFGEYNKEKVSELFRELNFFTLVSRLGQEHKEEKATEANNESQDTSKKATEKNIADAKKSDLVSIFLNEENIYFSYDGKESFYTNTKTLKDILEDEKIKKAGHSLKDIIKKLHVSDINLKNIYFDTQIAAYLINPGMKNYELSKLVFEHLGKDVRESQNNAEASHIFNLIPKLETEIKKHKLEKIFFDLEMPVVPVIANMEENGIRVDADKLHVLSKNLAERINEKEKNIFKLSKKEFNINSPAQLGIVLFEDIKIQGDEKVSKTKTGAYATGESELERFREKHKIIGEILEFRELSKLKNTYVDALPKLIDKDTGRIHTTYNQAGTSTGRLSSSDPNMQNLPQKGEFAGNIREAFIAEEGYSLVAFDYSQIELRIMAHLSKDENMMKVFKDGGDIHTKTAMEINNLSAPEEVTKDMRRLAKVLNFGILFGMGAKGVSDAAGIDMKTAKEFIERYFKTFPKIDEFIQNTIKHAQKTQYVETEIGRRRWLPDIKSKNWILRNAAERMAQNMPIQGLEADMLKIAMKHIYDFLKDNTKNDIKMLLQIHDELVFEMKDDIINDSSKKIRDIMESSYKLSVPVIVEISQGKDLAHMQKI